MSSARFAAWLIFLAGACVAAVSLAQDASATDPGQPSYPSTLTVQGRIVADAGICFNAACTMSLARTDADSVLFNGDGNDAFKVGTQASMGINSTNFWSFTGGGSTVGPLARVLGEGNVDLRLQPAGGGSVTFEAGGSLKGFVASDGTFVTVGGLPRKVGSYFPTQSTDTAFTAVGLPAPSLLAGTPTASNADTAYQMVQFQTGASSGNPSGLAGPFTTLRVTHLPRLYQVARTDASDITSTRLVFGFSASALEGVATLADANGIRGCWFRYDTGLSDTTWQAVSSDGTTASATNTTVSVAAATTYSLLVDAATVSGTCRFYVNGTLRVSKATNIPTGSTALGLQSSVTTLTNAARTVTVARILLEQK